MTVHRFLYKFCWRTKLLLPLVFLVCVIAMVILLSGSGGRFEYSAEGKLRIQYEHVHPLQPRHDHTWRAEDIRDEEKGLKMPAATHFLQGPEGEKAQAPPFQSQSDRYLDPNHQNALLFRRNLTRDSETDPLLKEALVDKVYLLKRAENTEKGTQEKKTRRRKRVKVHPGRNSGLFYNKTDPPFEFKYWSESATGTCQGNFVGYANEFAVLKNVVIENKYCRSEKKGGEFLEEVVNQPEEVEYFTYDLGCFQLKCSERPNYFFNNRNHMNDYMMGLQTHDVDLSRVNQVQKQFTVAVTRYEYANIYHTMTDWYNAFMLMQFLNKTQSETNILIIDAHPRGVLDPVWPVLFNSAIRLSQLPPRTLFADLAWSQIGYNSAMLNHYSLNLALVEEFRSFFLESYHVNSHHKLNCDKLKVLFVWRRDYVAHPRNPQGTVSRKVQNEREIIAVLQKRYLDFHITGVQIDLFDMQQQLKFVASADIMVGMHGAGLTHAFFLPKNSALIELVPSYWSAANDHFSAIANWRGLHYQRWVNEDPHNEAPNFYTHIPIPVIKVLVKNSINALCHKDQPQTAVAGLQDNAQKAALDELARAELEQQDKPGQGPSLEKDQGDSAAIKPNTQVAHVEFPPDANIQKESKELVQQNLLVNLRDIEKSNDMKMRKREVVSQNEVEKIMKGESKASALEVKDKHFLHYLTPKNSPINAFNKLPNIPSLVRDNLSNQNIMHQSVSTGDKVNQLNFQYIDSANSFQNNHLAKGNDQHTENKDPAKQNIESIRYKDLQNSKVGVVALQQQAESFSDQNFAKPGKRQNFLGTSDQLQPNQVPVAYHDNIHYQKEVQSAQQNLDQQNRISEKTKSRLVPMTAMDSLNNQGISSNRIQHLNINPVQYNQQQRVNYNVVAPQNSHQFQGFNNNLQNMQGPSQSRLQQPYANQNRPTAQNTGAWSIQSALKRPQWYRQSWDKFDARKEAVVGPGSVNLNMDQQLPRQLNGDNIKQDAQPNMNPVALQSLDNSQQRHLEKSLLRRGQGQQVPVLDNHLNPLGQNIPDINSKGFVPPKDVISNSLQDLVPVQPQFKGQFQPGVLGRTNEQVQAGQETKRGPGDPEFPTVDRLSLRQPVLHNQEHLLQNQAQLEPVAQQPKH